MKRALTWLLLILVWGVALFFGVRAWQRVERQNTAGEVCGALEAADLRRTVALSDGVDLPGPEGRRLRECRAFALFGLGQRDEGVQLVEETLEAARQEGSDWMPAPILTAAVVEDRRSQGRLQEAWALLDPAVQRYPQDPLLRSLELAVRTELEDANAVMDELRGQLPRMGAAAPTLALHLARRYLKGKEPERALELLGPEPPPSDELQKRWYRLRAETAAALGDTAGLAEWIQRWRQAGAPEEETQALHALLLSLYGLQDPDHPTLEMLQAAAEQGDEIPDAGLRRGVFVRLIGSLSFLGRQAEALALYEEKREALELDAYFDQQELERLLEQGEVDDDLLEQVGTLRYHLPDLGENAAGAVLLLSPEPTAPVDTAYETHPVAPMIEVRRHLGKSPQRWVLRDGAGQTRGSGTIWPADGATVDVEVEARPPATTPSFTARRAPADGRRRVIVVVLDCGDWRMIRYLLTRGDLPVLETLVETGRRGVLYSDPPSTSAAMEALVYPNRSRSPSFLGLVYQMGDEIAGLSFVGNNPFEPLHWLVPATDSLFDAMGAGERVAVNLLYSRGTVDAGRHGEMVGPRGQHRRFTGWQALRSFNEEEARRFPNLADEGRMQNNFWLAQEAAADFDATLTVIADPEIDLLVQRVASLDIMTHGNYGEATRAGQEDADHLLFDFYRYLDYRLGQAHNALDEDDLLIVLSDHGIKSSLQHLDQAFFLAVGDSVPAGRIPDTPNFRGVPRMIAGLFGVETDWPDTPLEEALTAP